MKKLTRERVVPIISARSLSVIAILFGPQGLSAQRRGIFL